MNLKQIWNKISNNGINQNHSFENKKRIKVMNLFCFLTVILSFSYVISLIIISAPLLSIFIEVLATVCGILTFFLIYRNYFNIATMFMLFTVPLGMTMLNYAFGKTGAEYFFFSAFILSFYLFTNPWFNRLLGVYLLVLFILSKHFEQTIVPPPEFANNLPIIYYLNICMTFIVGYVFLRLFVVEHESHRVQIETKNELLEKSSSLAMKKNEEIKILLKELSHRTKNNLQLMSSLINNQANKVTDSNAKKALLDSKNRIISIALLHKKLYQNENITTLSFKDYVDDLICHLVDVFDDKSNPVTVYKDIEDFNIKIDNAVTLGLIINELLTNSFKHGLTGDLPKYIRIQIHSIPSNELDFLISDSGTGINEMFKEKDTETFGAGLILSLIKQLDGKIINNKDEGNSLHIRLKYNL